VSPLAGSAAMVPASSAASQMLRIQFRISY
jgi:hypothetical protein